MSNDYFKAQGWFKTYALNSQDSRGVFQQLVKEDEEEAARLASAETDRIKEEMNKKLGPGTVKYGSEIKQPEMKTPQAIFEFSQRNPAAEGGRMKFDDGLSALNFGKEQNIFTPQSFQKILGAAGQRNYAPAYKVIIDSLKKAGIEYTSPKSAGATATFDNVTKETIDIFNKEATKLKAEAGLPMSRYQTSQLKKDIKIFVKDKLAKGEYVSRPIIKEHFGLDKKSGDMLITRSLGVNEKAGTGLLKNLGQEEKKAMAKTNFAKATATVMETKNDVLKIINDEFRLDPDLSNSEDLAKTIYGDQFPKGDMKNMSIEDLRKAEAFVRQTDNDVMSYLRVIKGLRDKPDGMRLPTQNVINDITDNILSGIEDEAAEGQSFKKKGFRFSSGILRDYKMALINKNLDLDPDTYRSERSKLVLKNKNLDEIFSLSALAEIAPGYTTKVQSIKKLINTRKASEIDLPFKKIMNALDEGKTSMQWNGKTVPIEDAIESFNKTSSKFSKREKVQSPKINYNEKFDESILDSYGKASQENIKKVYKDKNFFLSDIDPKIKTQDVLKDMEAYITDTTGKVKQPMVSSGFAGAYEMLSDDLKKIVDSEGFKKFANSKTAKGLSTVARAPGKLFGLGDILLGYLDYTNNKPMMSEAKAYQNMLQAMSFGIYRGGDEQNLKEIKEKFIANGGDSNIFDQVVTLNRQNADILKTVENTKKNYKKNLENEKASGNIIGNLGLKYQVDLPTASEQLKLDLNSLKSKAENMDKNFDIYKETYTGEDLTKPSKDLKRAAFDLLEEEQIKNYPSTYDQVNTESGPVMDKIYNSILTKDSYKKLLPQNMPSTINQLLGLNFKPVTEKEKEDALIKEMKKNAPQELYRYNKEFRNMDPDNPITMDETAKFMQKNKKTIGFSEGGITQLRSKYEYKK